MTRNPALRPQRMIQQAEALKASILRISVSVAAGFCLVVLIWRWFH
ncbi:MAG: hypothetical protein KA307_02335 [Burkholderiaceae bacterium]|jgi:hypothetical protein|nr:hypothetical protein [Burkholderiaceae bacterium]